MTVSRTLALARQILEPPHVWIKGDLARTIDGQPCKPTSPLAKRFDICGAIEAAAHRLHDGQAFHDADMLCLRLLREILRPHSIVAFNDRLAPDHANILALLDRAIATAKAEEQAPPPPVQLSVQAP
jgi:hypothetical protein